jgi:two-component system response regulator YesN
MQCSWGKHAGICEKIVIEIMASSLYELSQITRYGIAEKHGINVSNLSKRFVNDTGKTFLNFIDQEKMHRAKVLLELFPEITVEEISRLVGIAKIQHFRNKFKHIFYVTPGKYRRELSRKNNESMKDQIEKLTSLGQY